MRSVRAACIGPQREENAIQAGLIWLSLALALALALPASAAAQPVAAGAPAGVVTTLEGQAVVARVAAPAPVALKFRDRLFVRDRIETRQDAIVRVLLGGKAIVTIRELSVFTISEEPGRARVELGQGKAALGVAKSLLQPGEAIEIRTPNAVAAVRGSEIVVEVSESGGVPQSVITALEVSAPVTVAPLMNPAATVTLGVNQAVSVVGPASAPTITPVRMLTTAQLATAVRVAQAPRPREQSDRSPEGIAQKVSAERTQEAVQLSEVVAGGNTAPVTGAAFSPAVAAELDGAAQTYQRTQELLDVTSLRIDEIFQATGALIQRAFEAERLAPGFLLDGANLALDPTGGVTFGGTQSLLFNPIGGIFDSRVTQTGSGDLFAVAPGATVAFEGALVFIGNSSVVSTEGHLFSVGADASLTAGFGGSGVVSVGSGRADAGPTTVVTGGSVVAIGPRADVTLERPLLNVSSDTVVTAGVGRAEPVPLVDIGVGAHVRTIQALNLLSILGTVTASGSLLSLGADASLDITTDAGGLVGIGFQRETDSGLTGAVVTTGRELLVLGPRARLTTNQPLIAPLGSDLAIGTDLIRLEADARLVTSLPELVSISWFQPRNSDQRFPSHVTIGRHLLSIAAGAAVISESELTIPLISVLESSVAMGGDMVAISSGGTLGLGPHSLLLTGDASMVAGGSLLAIERDAVFTLQDRLNLPVLLFSSSAISVGGDMVSLAPEAWVAFERPLIAAFDTSLMSQRGLLALGANASLTVPDPTTRGFILVSGGAVALGGEAVWLGPGARFDLNRPLIQTQDGATFDTAAGMLTLGPGASLTSGGASVDFALLEFAGGPTRAGGPAVTIESGARLSLDRPLLASFGSDLTMPAGALRVRPGGQVSATATADFFVGLGGGTHAIGTAPGASVFDLAGLATGVDAESGLTLGADRPVQYPGSLLVGAGASLSAGRVVRLDTALLEATAPLVDLRRGTEVTTAADVLDLTLRAKLSGVGPLVSLDGSSLSVLAGALANVAGGSFLKVVGDLLDLRNGSTLRLLNGPVLSVSGNSAVNITGGLVAFNGTGGNALSIANGLCPCTVLGGLPVALQNGATPANVSIGANAIRNPGLGTVSFASPSAAAIVVSGPASRVTIGGVAP